jgi:hypothetical protein
MRKEKKGALTNSQFRKLMRDLELVLKKVGSKARLVPCTRAVMRRLRKLDNAELPSRPGFIVKEHARSCSKHRDRMAPCHCEPVYR